MKIIHTKLLVVVEDGGVYVINQKTGTVKYCVSLGAVGEESFKTLCTKHTK